MREKNERELSALLLDKDRRQKKESSKEAEYCAYKAELQFKQALYKYSRVGYSDKRHVTIQSDFLHRY